MKAIKEFLLLDKKDQIIFFLLCSLIVNSITAVVKLTLAIYLPSLWFAVNAGFAFVLAASRYVTIRKYKMLKHIDDETEKLKQEYKTYSKNGVLLILLGIMYFFVSSYMCYNGTNTTMHEYITYLVALIAFYSISVSIYGMVKYKANNDPIIKAIKITNFASALTSIVLTQVVLLDTFANEYNSSINGYTGMGVSLIIMMLGLYMILGIKKIEKCT